MRRKINLKVEYDECLERLLNFLNQKIGSPNSCFDDWLMSRQISAFSSDKFPNTLNINKTYQNTYLNLTKHWFDHTKVKFRTSGIQFSQPTILQTFKKYLKIVN